VFATWAHRMVWCQYYAEELGDGRGHHEQEQHEDHYVSKYNLILCCKNVLFMNVLILQREGLYLSSESVMNLKIKT